MKNITRIARAAFLGSMLSVSAWAGLLGTSVTGNMNIAATNYFDPANGSVPAGYGNSSPGGITVTIADPLWSNLGIWMVITKIPWTSPITR